MMGAHPIRWYRVVSVVLAAFCALMSGPSGAAAAVDHELIKGSGSSWAANAVNQWVADVQSKGLQITYTANGAAQGRKDYLNRANDFSVTDSPFHTEQGEDPAKSGRTFAYLPVAAGGTSFPYNLPNVKNLRLSGPTIAKIFTNKITKWNDPAITADNNGKPVDTTGIQIIPVVRADGAGVTNQFTTWMAKEHGALWKACNGGKNSSTYFFPANCGASSGPMKAQSGSEGVMNFVKQPANVGSIAMEEYSYPLQIGFPVVKMLNAAGYYTAPTQYNVAVALTAAKIQSDPRKPNYLIQQLDAVYRNPDKRTYPLSSYVYAIIPTAKEEPKKGVNSTGKRQTLADFLYFSICQGQREIGPIGYSPLPYNLVAAGFDQLKKTKFATNASTGKADESKPYDPKVVLDGRNPSTCSNPTFNPNDLSENCLAKIAPQPPEEDRQGKGPSADNAGKYNANPEKCELAADADKINQGGGDAGDGSGGSGDSSSSSTGSGSTTAPVVSSADAASGDLGVGGAGNSAVAGTAVATTLAADRTGPSPVLTLLVVGLFVSVLVVPAVLSRVLADSRGQR